MTDTPKRAVFLDRDNVIVAADKWLARPEDVKLIPEAVEAIRRLRQGGYCVVVATNQSAVARGLIDEPTLQAIHERIRELLAEQDAAIEAIYYCPYLRGPDAVVEAYRKDSDLRKPRPGMLLKAARELGLDLAGSWSIGDSARDVEAGRAAGCRTILITRDESAGATTSSGADFEAASLSQAVDIVLAKASRPERAPRPAGGQAASDRLIYRLEELIELLHRQHRAAVRADFSLAKLAGAVVQMIALGITFWGFMAMIDEQLGRAMVRFLFAIVVQLLALTLFALHRQR